MSAEGSELATKSDGFPDSVCSRTSNSPDSRVNCPRRPGTDASSSGIESLSEYFRTSMLDVACFLRIRDDRSETYLHSLGVGAGELDHPLDGHRFTGFGLSGPRSIGSRRFKGRWFEIDVRESWFGRPGKSLRNPKFRRVESGRVAIECGPNRSARQLRRPGEQVPGDRASLAPAWGKPPIAPAQAIPFKTVAAHWGGPRAPRPLPRRVAEALARQ